ncbi:MAG TPA: GAF domain-containing protein, partial [Candidatus Limnocylindrales bacterium]|nr:GAF domain-containing protein [Candidatus Limnocylindrales bacterium]
MRAVTAGARPTSMALAARPGVGPVAAPSPNPARARSHARAGAEAAAPSSASPTSARPSRAKPSEAKASGAQPSPGNGGVPTPRSLGEPVAARSLNGSAPIGGAYTEPALGGRESHVGDAATTDALRRLAADLSRADGVQEILDEVLDNSVELFHADRVAVWFNDPAHERPLELAAARALPIEIQETVSRLSRDHEAAGLRALRLGTVLVFRDIHDPGITDEMRAQYVEAGVASVCFVPAMFRGDPLALIVLYHHRPYAWSLEEVALARSFGDSIATAIGNTRLVESVEGLAARLRAVQELSARLSSLQDLRGIGEAIVSEAHALITCDTIRVYRVDHETGWCEPIAFQGVFLGTPNPSPAQLRVRIGSGLTG